MTLPHSLEVDALGDQATEGVRTEVGEALWPGAAALDLQLSQASMSAAARTASLALGARLRGGVRASGGQYLGGHDDDSGSGGLDQSRGHFHQRRGRRSSLSRQRAGQTLRTAWQRGGRPSRALAPDKRSCDDQHLGCIALVIAVSTLDVKAHTMTVGTL
ncbi:hypothetical protein EBM89_00600 [Cellulomonas triticagri]|uniref:Uncharacterized protein n=1 Tax=Cellulomonas triticagri TaxID=2483352 RepID=A0A3M2JU62_9CELL|nr:hypothetical protein EBM89_00600 [Cellulomonas triticagri]